MQAINVFLSIIILLIVTQRISSLSTERCITTSAYVCSNVSMEDIKSSIKSMGPSVDLDIIIKNSYIQDVIDDAFLNQFNIFEHVKLYNNTLNSIQVSTSFKRLHFDNNTILNIKHGAPKVSFTQFSIFAHRLAISLNFTGNTIRNMEPQAFNLSSIKEVDLQGTGLTSIQPGVFRDMYDLSLIDLSDNNLTDLQYGTFETLKQRYSFGIFELILNLRNNKISIISPEAFNNVNIMLLDLSQNNIETLDNGIFSDTQVKILNLSNNYISRIQPEAFNGILIRQLILSNNKIKVLKAKTFEFLNTVSHFDISENPIVMIEPNGFYGLSNVRNEKFLTSTGVFKIPRFRIPVIKRELFNGLASLNSLNLTDYGIETIESEGFYGLNTLEELYLSKNNITILNYEVFVGLQTIAAIDLSYNNINELDVGSLRGLEKTSRMLQLNLQNNNLSYLPVGLFENTPTLRKLNVANNQITEMEVGLFSGLKMMNNLNVSNNQIYEIRKELLYPMLALGVLDISNNNLTYIEIEDILIHIMNLKSININNNMWGCKTLKIITDVMIERKIDFLSSATEHYHLDNVHGVTCIPGQEAITAEYESESSEEDESNVERILQEQHRALLALVCIVGVGTIAFLLLYVVSNRQKLLSGGELPRKRRRASGLNDSHVELVGIEQ